MKLVVTHPHSLWRRLGLFTLALVMLMGCGPRAMAAATSCTSAGGTLDLPAVTVPQNPAVGSLVGSPATVTVTFTCSNLPYSQPTAPSYYSDTATIQAGNLAPADATDNPNGSNGIMFATNLPGLALQLTASPVQANDRAWVRGGPGSTRGFEPGAVTAPSSSWQCIQYKGNGSCSTYGGTYGGSVSETFTAQLIVTGPVTTGTLNAINLMQFNWYVYGIGPSEGYFATLALGSTTVKSAACSVAVDPTVVTLPAVLASAFTGTGATAGQTPFNVQLSCQTGASLSITLATANQQTGTTSVIAPTAGNGYAGNVGVQLLDGKGNPITFGTAISEGATSSGTMNLPFNARYYQTAPGATAGLVTATATYTLTYQ
ncbi:fimbrial protein [Rhodanobacter sp. DHB23]|uniref:fimbrial protein n=1 Tax=Rhodanobacter sp. DHB23 TaxID=2775923 RepID=UPI00177DD832|nr:fimbrial protein [Rhodanobacter sp. DHB23]MBD8874257.1 fimbrial protein [Rhodanobacter sp. DHB23]